MFTVKYFVMHHVVPLIVLAHGEGEGEGGGRGVEGVNRSPLRCAALLVEQPRARQLLSSVARFESERRP